MVQCDITGTGNNYAEGNIVTVTTGYGPFEAIGWALKANYLLIYLPV